MTAERDFANFRLGDNVYELANGLIPEIGERLDVEVGEQPTSTGLQGVMDVVGRNKVLRQNEEVTAIDPLTMADLVERSGVQKPLNRSLWTPGIYGTGPKIDAYVIMGAVANWQDRTAALFDRRGAKPIYSIAGTREMKTATEVTNPNIVRLFEKFHRYPTEAEYVASIVVPRIVRTGRHDVLPIASNTDDGDELMFELFDKNPQLLEKRLAVARVANAGIMMAVQLRTVAQTLRSDFDADPRSPQVFVITDSLPVDHTPKQNGNPQRVQKAATALRQVVLTAKKLHEAAGGQ